MFSIIFWMIIVPAVFAFLLGLIASILHSTASKITSNPSAEV